MRFLKPKLLNVLMTIIVLCLPFLKERVSLPEGGFVIERYAPIVLIGAYLWLRDYFPFIQMIGFSLVVYFAVSVVVAVFSKFFGKHLDRLLRVRRG